MNACGASTPNIYPKTCICWITNSVTPPTSPFYPLAPHPKAQRRGATLPKAPGRQPRWCAPCSQGDASAAHRGCLLRRRRRRLHRRPSLQRPAQRSAGQGGATPAVVDAAASRPARRLGRRLELARRSCSRSRPPWPAPADGQPSDRR
ncbi:hypothetical protein R5R35_001958 [Gryllus longicercus]|uniref:Uncharacterized protein n=1 Tax=Gryllus longicercus TaxID=2509291 RepID=A0AAN9W172_9ORTH